MLQFSILRIVSGRKWYLVDQKGKMSSTFQNNQEKQNIILTQYQLLIKSMLFFYRNTKMKK